MTPPSSSSMGWWRTMVSFADFFVLFPFERDLARINRGFYDMSHDRSPTANYRGGIEMSFSPFTSFTGVERQSKQKESERASYPSSTLHTKVEREGVPAEHKKGCESVIVVVVVVKKCQCRFVCTHVSRVLHGKSLKA